MKQFRHSGQTLNSAKTLELRCGRAVTPDKVTRKVVNAASRSDSSRTAAARPPPMVPINASPAMAATSSFGYAVSTHRRDRSAPCPCAPTGADRRRRDRQGRVRDEASTSSDGHRPCWRYRMATENAIHRRREKAFVSHPSRQADAAAAAASQYKATAATHRAGVSTHRAGLARYDHRGWLGSERSLDCCQQRIA